jgi:precorrin-2 dehydrogenase / sirohydrochlorin ferrochelatase
MRTPQAALVATREKRSASVPTSLIVLDFVMFSAPDFDTKAMGYLPIFVNLKGRDCLVIGGDSLAESRVRALCEADASVTVIAPEITPALVAMADAEMIRWIARDYAAGDMRGRFMAWVATVNEAVGRAAAADARQLGVLINVADRPALCDFITPAVVRRGEVQIAIATGGASPALARRLREQLEAVIGPEYAEIAELLRSARRWLKGHMSDASERQRILAKLVGSDLIGAFRRRDLEEAERLVGTHLGTDFAELGFSTDAPESSKVSLIASRAGHA